MGLRGVRWPGVTRSEGAVRAGVDHEGMGLGFGGMDERPDIIEARERAACQHRYDPRATLPNACVLCGALA